MKLKIRKKGKSSGKASSPMRASVSFSSELYQTLEDLAKEKKVSLAWIIRDAAEKYITDGWPLLDFSHNGHDESNHTFKFIDLFAGIGGFRKAFGSVGGKCVFTSEWDLNSQKTYLANFECSHPVVGDITQVSEKDIPEHDLLLAGFPCQPFSIAGVSKKNALGRKHGFSCETQGTLFFDIARILAHHRPAAFVLENVKNLASHDKGKTFAIIRKTLEEEIGYFVQYRIIDAKSFVPQHRERIFMVGFREPSNFRLADLKIPDPASGPKLKQILHPEDGSETEEFPYTIGPSGKVNQKYTLTPDLWNYLKTYAEKHKAKGNGFGFGLAGPDDTTRTLSARYYKDGSEILVKQPKGRPRRLTPRECARLMGFDQPGNPPMIIPVSDTQAYRQFGNAVVVPVVEAIARGIFPYLQKALSDSRAVSYSGKKFLNG